MDINFLEKIPGDFDTLIIFLFDGKSIGKKNISEDLESKIQICLKNKDFNKDNFYELFSYNEKGIIKKIHVYKVKNFENLSDYSNFSGSKFLGLETKKNSLISVISEDCVGFKFGHNEIIAELAFGFHLKNYSFRKYKTLHKKTLKSVSKINFYDKNNKKIKPLFENLSKLSQGIFLTRDLVSEPANVLFPEKFAEYSKILSKAGLKIDIFDENKIKKLGMNALIGVAQGSVKPPRVMVMNWKGSPNKSEKPIAFVGKGVTFDTGGISIKPSGGMEDMKWDMGGAAVVTGLMYNLALRKAKVNAVGIVGLVENMPDGNAQRPGDVVKSMSGQTIEVLNTDAEGRLVLADILWYIKENYKPKLMIDLATLTGAIIVALGDRYAGLFSNNDDLANKLFKSSKSVNELIWRLPMDNEFDKLLNCDIADMRNITNSRGAGSITAAQFLKRFVGDTSWAHLDIAGVTWSKKGTKISRPGGTGFGVRLLDNFIKQNHEL